MAFDYKKEYKEFYLPSRKPHLITVPPMNFVTVQGKGDPNDPAGEYQAAMEVLYGLAYTIKMSYKGSHRMEGFFEYVVPPLEGLWHQQGVDGVDYAHKETFEWTSMIRLPEFVTREEFDWAVQEATAKKKRDFSTANSGPMTRDYAYSACILALTTQSRRLCGRWMRLRQSRDMCRILRQGACIRRSIWGTRAAQPQKNLKPCCGIRYGKNKNRKIHKGCRFCL